MTLNDANGTISVANSYGAGALSGFGPINAGIGVLSNTAGAVSIATSYSRNTLTNTGGGSGGFTTGRPWFDFAPGNPP